jgi:hypothetical protein
LNAMCQLSWCCRHLACRWVWLEVPAAVEMRRRLLSDRTRGCRTALGLPWPVPCSRVMGALGYCLQFEHIVLCGMCKPLWACADCWLRGHCHVQRGQNAQEGPRLQEAVSVFIKRAIQACGRMDRAGAILAWFHS